MMVSSDQIKIIVLFIVLLRDIFHMVCFVFFGLLFYL